MYEGGGGAGVKIYGYCIIWRHYHDLHYKMPKYTSKTQSKNSRRYKKQTKRKLRRGRKSRKVMRGGEDYKFTNEELIKAYNNYVQSQGYNALFQLRMYVFPTLFTLTNVGKSTAMDRQNRVPEFWLKEDAFETALREDPTLNEKINGNAYLIQTLKLKTPAQIKAEKDAADARKLIAEQEKTPEEKEAAKWRNPYFIY